MSPAPSTRLTNRLALLASTAILLVACGSTVTYLEGDGGQGPGDGGRGGDEPPPPCAPPLVDCGGDCVDLSNDPQHCGSCPVGCGPDQVCSQWECSGGCDPGLTDCGGSCVDTNWSSDHCGGCFSPCSFDESCQAGYCLPDAPCAPLTDCWGECVDLENDPDHCGACGTICGAGSTCSSGQCGPDCGSLTLCGGSCVDVLSDPQHCGGCNSPCGDEQICQGGQCQCADPLCGVCDVVPLDSTVPLAVSGTTSVDHQEPSCAPPGSPDDGFLFTAPMDGSYVFDTVGSSYDTVLYLRQPASCGELACNDDDGGLTSEVTLDMVAGEQVIVVVDGWAGASGSYELHIDVAASNPCPLADLGSTTPQTVSGSTVGMSSEYTGLCAGAGPEVSYGFTAPAAGNYLFTTQGSSYDTVLYVVDGSCGGAPLACNDDYGGTLQSLIYLVLQQNQNVVVFVDSFSQPGSYVLNVSGPM